MPKLESTLPFVSCPIWGGEKLKKYLDHPPSEVVGELWLNSTLDSKKSLWKDRLNELEVSNEDMPYLIKLLDCSRPLSIQVHPAENTCRGEQELPKTEAWYILETQAGAGLYLGLKEGVEVDDFKKAVLNKDDVSELLNFYPCQKGDVFFVPAGTVHALGGGLTLLEVQQMSGTTFRLWDWNRVDASGNSRELHIERGLQVLKNYDAKELFLGNFNGLQKELVSHQDFRLHSLTSSKTFKNLSRYSLAFSVEGQWSLNGRDLEESRWFLGNEEELDIRGNGQLLLIL